jgi:error-prone DNA polymerase
LNDLGYEFPRYPVPDGETMDSFLRKRVAEGSRCGGMGRRMIRALLETSKEAGGTRTGAHRSARLCRILPDRLGHRIEFCKRNGILVQGRGSAANSAVCYALEITAIDPVGMELLFERFLSESRGEWPDIDLDLPSEEKREQAIQYVYQRYGELGAAMTANVITYRGKSARAKWARRLGFDQESLGRLSSSSAVGVARQDRHDGPLVSKCRLRHPASAHRQVSRAVHEDSGHCRATSASTRAAWSSAREL